MNNLTFNSNLLIIINHFDKDISIALLIIRFITRLYMYWISENYYL